MRRFLCFASMLAILLCAAAEVWARSETDGTLVVPIETEVMTSDFPDPSRCEVQPADALGGLAICPTDPSPIPASVVTITVRNGTDTPMAGASVVVQLGGSHVRCGSNQWGGLTDASGTVVLTLGAGGCSDGIGNAGIIKANGVTIRAYNNVKSPDFDGASGDLAVDIADLLEFSREFIDGGPGCHDYDNDGTTGLSDLILFSPAFAASHSCAP